MRPVLLRLSRILLGYCVAAFASGACVLGGATVLAFVQKSMTGTGELAPFSHSLVSLVLLSVMLMFLGALPALAVGLIAESLKIRHWLYYVLGGVLICMVMWRGLPFQGTGDFQFFLFAGALGGAVYWRIAGRKAGEWMRDAEEEADPIEDANDRDAPDDPDVLELPTRPAEALPANSAGDAEPPQTPQRPESWVRSR